eukprot:scaffold568_cov160-Amphora_coffeaeformis.AAC.20
MDAEKRTRMSFILLNTKEASSQSLEIRKWPRVGIFTHWRAGIGLTIPVDEFSKSVSTADHSSRCQGLQYKVGSSTSLKKSALGMIPSQEQYSLRTHASHTPNT